MKEGQQQFYHWQFSLSASPAKLWPYVSDTNRIFRILGATPVSETSLSRSTPKGSLELSHNKLKSYVSWRQTPYIWEYPYRFGVSRHYKLGILKELRFSTEFISLDDETRVSIKIWVQPTNPLFSFIIKAYVEYIIKRRLAKYLQQVDESISKSLRPYEISKPKKLVRGAERKIKTIKAQLIENSKRKRIVNRLFDLIQLADDEELERIHPYSLAEYWGEKKYSVLNVFLHAAKLDLLDFSWDVCCPKCKSPKHTFRKMREARVHLYCNDCESDYMMDFNRNTHLVFTPHPLIRKITDKKYSLGGPQSKPHRVTQQSIDIGSERYPQIQLEEGTYLFRTHNHEGHLILHVREEGTDNITIFITDEELDGQEITISTNPNLIISNRSSEKAVCFIDKMNWKEEAIYASEVSSSHDFRELFSRETLKETSKVKASEVTMLFTDLMNSTELYVQEGDESAIGRVMGHFKIIQQIVAEERGGIVKTIGDSVMAVFWEPVSALKAVQRIQQIFTTSTSMGDAFKIKAGVHFGDCTAVNLNGRIDYFGTTVNIASRLVDIASEKEIMVSEAVFNHPDVQLYLDKHSDTFFVKESMKELKGFDDEEFKVKQIRLERPPMRLVI
ncbi:MAG: adenylate/guanylate cyclase domain-containing protein [Gracilimonas sp.]|uniref:adenylate/guanylate cyclase domain-containing protein n=1 Tax=Gracilimonas sp. TaxID=1974203 RepID=UPI001B0CF287|nr:adenylate/guanylate cyclase domain-containing protein [Gracilimonas sp.]MBO6585984.1 adenylate/guanylate cyclase domain-containing protein [Gracilimonas sp.]MBO6616981.1 adenylate/guanylate cyclase domain-containing protein [Gracilimonas sp.]